MDDQPDQSGVGELPTSNVTHANVTGKVLRIHSRGGGNRRHKPVKMSADKKKHVKSLIRRGAISPRAAVQNGLQGRR